MDLLVCPHTCYPVIIHTSLPGQWSGTETADRQTEQRRGRYKDPKMSFGMPSQLTQVHDSPIPSPPSDSVYSLSLNGSLQSSSTMLIAGSWDKSVSDSCLILCLPHRLSLPPSPSPQVSCYEIQYGNDRKISNVIPQAQISHEGPVFCTDIATVSLICSDPISPPIS